MTAADVSSHDDSIPNIISAMFSYFDAGMFYALKSGAKIRILSDIFTIFASWTSINFQSHKKNVKNILAYDRSDNGSHPGRDTGTPVTPGADVHHKEGSGKH